MTQLERFSTNRELLLKYVWLADLINTLRPVDFEASNIYDSPSLRKAPEADLIDHPDWESRIIPIWRYTKPEAETRFYVPPYSGVSPPEDTPEYVASFIENWSWFIQRGIRW